MKSQITTQAKVGVFILIVLIISFWLTFRLGKYGEKVGGYKIYAVFDNAYGVTKETPVFIAGIKVGYVEAKDLKNSQAIVKMRIFEKYKIPVDSIASIKMRGLLGDKYIDIKTGNPEAGFLKDGDYIKKSEIPLDIENLSSKLSEVADNLSAITKSLKGALGTEEAQESLTSIIQNIKNFVEKLSERMDKNAGKIDSIISDLKEVASYLRERTPDLSGKIEKAAGELSDILSTSKGDTKQALASFRKAADDASATLKRAKEVMRKIDEGEGVLGQLVSDKEMGNKFKKVVNSISESMEVASKMSVDLIYRGEFDPVSNRGNKNFFGVKLSPRPGKFYLFEVASVPRDTITSKTTIEKVNDTETKKEITEQRNKLKFSLEYGRRIGMFTLRGGLIQSTGGFGVDISFLNDYITFTLDAYDFTRKTNPALKAGLDITLYRYFYLYAGVDDLINDQWEQRFFVGGGVRITDEDLKKLLGIAATAAAGTGY